MGSDMSYEDMMTDQPLLEQYIAEVTSSELIENRQCWIVVLKAKTFDVSYSTRKMWVDIDRYVPLKAELYSRTGKLIKRITFSNVQRVDGRWFPMLFTYKDMFKEGSGTKMTVLEIKQNLTLPSKKFQLSQLK